MGFEELSQELSLSNICRGALEADFQKIYQEVLAALKAGEKGAISIKITLERKDDGPMVWTEYTIGRTLPTKKVISYAQMTGDGKLKTAAPEKKSENLTLFPGGKQAKE